MSEDDAQLIHRALSLAEETFLAGSGPGGQNVNKVATAVQLRVNIYRLGLHPRIFNRLKELAGSRLNSKGEIVLLARNHRSQEANREDARKRLTELIENALNEPKRRAKTRVNRVGKVQRLKSKKARGQVKVNRGKVDW